jgi:hypothetical protein
MKIAVKVHFLIVEKQRATTEKEWADFETVYANEKNENKQ